ncbi:hypothetical protein [Saccharopolyspora hattusasensis]|uniref:hypothetical protein n=1 Tax=Saccharopolyspora hattusasensis TaxID=1128679 RepID=UPI003D996AFA
MVVRALHQVGLRSTHLQVLSLGSVLLCLGLWVRAKTVDEEQRDNAERRALSNSNEVAMRSTAPQR